MSRDVQTLQSLIFLQDTDTHFKPLRVRCLTRPAELLPQTLQACFESPLRKMRSTCPFARRCYRLSLFISGLQTQLPSILYTVYCIHSIQYTAVYSIQHTVPAYSIYYYIVVDCVFQEILTLLSQRRIYDLIYGFPGSYFFESDFCHCSRAPADFTASVQYLSGCRFDAVLELNSQFSAIGNC